MVKHMWVGFHHFGQICVTDKWFQWPLLYLDLLKIRVYAMGTMISYIKGF